MYSSYQAGVPPSGGLEVGQTLWFFLEALCAQTNLFWREMKINKLYSETLYTIKKIFALSRSATY